MILSTAAADDPHSQAPMTAAPPTASPASELRLKIPLARPACTHTIMNRVYGCYICQVCHRIPSAGFLYSCQQDSVSGALAQLAPPVSNLKATRKKLKKTQHETHGKAWSTATQLEMLGFHKTVVKAAEQGHYTSEQVAILKAQKLKVKRTIEQSQEDREILMSKTGPSPAVLSHKLAALSPQKAFHQSTADYGAESEQKNAPKDDKETKNRTKKAKGNHYGPPTKPALSKAFQICQFKVCHTCRPLFRDRCFTSFEAAYAGEIQPLTFQNPEHMPVAPVSIMKTIGLREPPVTPDEAYSIGRAHFPSVLREFNYGFCSGSPLPDAQIASVPLAKDGLNKIRADSAGTDRQSLMHVEKCEWDLSSAGDIDHDFDSKLKLEELDQLSDLNTRYIKRAKIKPQPSSLGFRATLARDMQDIIERANRDASKTHSRKTEGSMIDPLTGLDGRILEKLKALYRKDGKEVFDLDLWKAMSDSILHNAARTPLPGEDDDDDLEDVPALTINGLGIIIDESRVPNEEGDIGLALTEEAAENLSPDIITSV